MSDAQDQAGHAPADRQPVASAAPKGPTAPRAWSSPVAWTFLIAVLGLGLALDLFSKHWAFQHVAGQPVVLVRQQLLADPELHPIPPHPGVHALPWGLLDFQLVINRGAVFGLGENQRFFFIVFTVGALMAGFFVFARFTRADAWLAHLAIGLILAGGIGNLYDRIVYSVVRDFLHMLPAHRLPFEWTWPGGSPHVFPWVFNVADVMLLAGMAILMIHINRVERHRKLLEDHKQSGGQASQTSLPTTTAT